MEDQLTTTIEGLDNISFNDIIDMMSDGYHSRYDIEDMIKKSKKDVVKELFIAEYFRKFDNRIKRQEIINMALEKSSKLRDEKLRAQYEINKKRRKEQEKKQAEKAYKLKEEINVGDIIKVAGTRDGTGYRLVLKKEQYHVECQKLSYRRKTKMFEKESYITTHYWEKVREILHSNPHNLIES